MKIKKFLLNLFECMRLDPNEEDDEQEYNSNEYKKESTSFIFWKIYVVCFLLVLIFKIYVKIFL